MLTRAMSHDPKPSGGGSQESGRLHFDSPEDAANFVRDFVKRGDRLPPRKDLNISEEYIEGRADVVLQMCMRSADQAHVFDLVFCRVPPAKPDAPLPNMTSDQTDATVNGGGAQRDRHAMRLDVSYAVKTPQGLIPSLVWAEPFNERADCRGNADDFLVQFLMDADGVVGERKAGVVGRRAGPNRNSAGINGMIESVAQVGEGILGNSSELARQARCQADLVNILSSISVEVDHAGIWLSLKESLDPRVEIIDVIPCVAQDFSQAIKGVVGHGEIQKARR